MNMLGLLNLPPRLMAVIALAVVAYLVYHIVSIGKVQPLAIIILVLAIFALVRSLFRLRHKVQASENEDD